MQKFQIRARRAIKLRPLAVVFVVAAVLAGGIFFTGAVKADQFDQKIKALERQNAASQSRANRLADRASSYQDAVNRLDSQINKLQAQIVANQVASQKLQALIKKKKAELEHQRQVLGENIKAMYLEGEISTLEILASSNDLSEFVNKEVSRNAVQNKVKDTVDQITQLKIQLEQKQRELQSRIRDQKDRQSELAATEAEQSQLLAFTESQKADFEAQIRSNNQEIAHQRAMQLASNQALGGHVVAGDPGHGGYPAYLDNAYQDSLVDPWGMFNRECVSYTAWKVQQAFGYMPYWGGHGNANQWPASARADGIPTGSTPRVHSVAISMGGAYGHAMWVEAVSGNMIYVSQYNFDLAGHYSEMWVNGSNFTYLYFG